MKIAAFDIGGTALKMGVMTRDGRLLETARQSITDKMRGKPTRKPVSVV